MTTFSLRSEAFARGARVLRTALGPAIAAYLEDSGVNPDGRGLEDTGCRVTPADAERIVRPEGYAGLKDEVDYYWGMLFNRASLSTLLSVGSEAGISGNNNESLADAIQQGMSESVNRTGQQAVGRSLNIQPTIAIRPGFPVRVMSRTTSFSKSYRS